MQELQFLNGLCFELFRLMNCTFVTAIHFRQKERFGKPVHCRKIGSDIIHIAKPGPSDNLNFRCLDTAAEFYLFYATLFSHLEYSAVQVGTYVCIRQAIILWWHQLKSHEKFLNKRRQLSATPILCKKQSGCQLEMQVFFLEKYTYSLLQQSIRKI